MVRPADCNRECNRGYAKFFSRSHDAVIRVYDDAGDVIETHERVGEFKVWYALEIADCKLQNTRFSIAIRGLLGLPFRAPS